MTARASVTFTTTPQGAFLLDTRTGACYALNTVGAAIWKQLLAGQAVDLIVDSVRTTFASTPDDTLRGDVLTFIAALQNRDLLSSTDTAA
jgi:hypothetical protein